MKNDVNKIKTKLRAAIHAVLKEIKDNFSLLLTTLTMLKIKIEAIVNKNILVVKISSINTLIS